jgi:predicted glycosyltransferase
MMAAWIDMDNSPHVPLLIPFAKYLASRQYQVSVTARDYAQTIDLLKQSGLPYTRIGKHGGAGSINKVASLFGRVAQLLKYARNKRFSMARNHGSRAQALACKILGIPCFIGMDYEHTESRIFSICASRIWIPAMLSPRALPIIGIHQNKVLTYPGIKEQFYLANFNGDEDFRSRNGIPEKHVLVVLRPPADMAHYHNQKSEVIFQKMIEIIGATKNTYTICTPRSKDQAAKLRTFATETFRILDTPMDGKNLAYHSDLMISGGGTMNREAAYFGTRVYSIFSGPKPMLDLELQKMGLLSFIESVDDCNRIKFIRKAAIGSSFTPGTNVLGHLVDQFINLSNGN